jgi:phosphoribosyl 1,2-cyclic phosphodiesterase
VKFCVLGSGSGGNATWVQEGPKAILIDNGFSASDLIARAEAKGLNVSCLEAVVISHEHSDHVKGVGPLARRLNLTVWATEGTAKAAAPTIKNVRVRTFEAGAVLDLRFLTIATVPVSHDAADPVAFAIQGKAAVLGLVTDLGKATHLVRESFKNVDALVVEFNHDRGMLLDGPYHPKLKQRVMGLEGHLSNEAGADLLERLWHAGLKTVILGHLSETNNTPVLALAEARRALDSLGAAPELLAAEQDRATPVFEI